MGLDEITNMKTLAHSSYSNQGRQPEGESISPETLKDLVKSGFGLTPGCFSPTFNRHVFIQVKIQKRCGPINHLLLAGKVNLTHAQ